MTDAFLGVGYSQQLGSWRAEADNLWLDRKWMLIPVGSDILGYIRSRLNPERFSADNTLNTGKTEEILTTGAIQVFSVNPLTGESVSLKVT